MLLSLSLSLSHPPANTKIQIIYSLLNGAQVRFPLRPSEVKVTDGESIVAREDGEREREREREEALASVGGGEREEALASVGGVIAVAPAAQSLSLSREMRKHLVSLLSATTIDG